MDKDKAIQFVKGMYGVADNASESGQMHRGLTALMPELLEYLDKAEIPEPQEDPPEA